MKLLNVIKDLYINSTEYEWIDSYLKKPTAIKIYSNNAAYCFYNNNITTYFQNSLYSILRTINGVPAQVYILKLFLCNLKYFHNSVPAESTDCIFADDTNLIVLDKNQDIIIIKLT